MARYAIVKLARLAHRLLGRKGKKKVTSKDQIIVTRTS